MHLEATIFSDVNKTKFLRPRPKEQDAIVTTVAACESYVRFMSSSVSQTARGTTDY